MKKTKRKEDEEGRRKIIRVSEPYFIKFHQYYLLHQKKCKETKSSFFQAINLDMHLCLHRYHILQNKVFSWELTLTQESDILINQQKHFYNIYNYRFTLLFMFF